MKMALLIGAGGFFGTLGRYGCGLLIAALTPMPGLTTFVVNLIGSFLIGWVYGMGAPKLGPQTMNILAIGMLGGFTTYSAFSNESLLFFKEGRFLYGVTYVVAMFAACLIATAGGYKLAT